MDRRPLRLPFALVATVLVVGAIVLAVVLIAAADDGDESTTSATGVELTAGQANGRSLFARRCASCHQLADANAVGRTGPSLDAMQPPRQLLVDAITNGRARGSGQMPAGLVTGSDTEDVADYVVAVAGRTR